MVAEATDAVEGPLDARHVTPEVAAHCGRNAPSSPCTAGAAAAGAREGPALGRAASTVPVGQRAAPSPVARRRERKGRVSLADLFKQANRPSQLLKPHQANDEGWEAIERVREKDGELSLHHFKLIRRVGCGDIGSVYLAELQGTRLFRFAMKVMDLGSLASRRKQLRAETERDILSVLDHPFLPTLYAHFETPQFLCLVMEFCPGGDLHSLRQKQDGRFFSVKAARFYAAEVLLALEYLHMMGVVYRDLKPENVLVRGDGHVMLSDFDLSLKCAVSPTILTRNRSHGRPRSASKAKSRDRGSTQGVKADDTHACYDRGGGTCLPRNRRMSLNFSPCADVTSSEAVDPGKPNKLGSAKWKPSLSKVASKPCAVDQVAPLPELVAEPSGVRSMSFVGTHEYLAPEIISGEGHGSPVDWWTFGVFLFELLYGKTPFRGEENEITLVNVLAQPLEFPAKGDPYHRELEPAVQELIKALLVKDPQKRLGFNRGATEVKQHPFFDGINWALIRCTLPPQIPRTPNRSLRQEDGLHPPSSKSGPVAAKPSPSPTGRDPQHVKNYDMIGDSADRSTMRFDYF